MKLNVFASVSDKSGLADALKELSLKFDLHIISSGGTANHLRESGFHVEDVESLTGFAEMFGGRVKTLHPMVHMGLLYRDEKDKEELASQGGKPFHIVVANLYPFEATAERTRDEAELIEKIDIGGVALLRASAKNFRNIAVFCDPVDYPKMVDAYQSVEIRKELALKTFRRTGTLDLKIAETLGEDGPMSFEPEMISQLSSHQALRYGENPQQNASWWIRPGEPGWQDAKILQGKEMSFNNFLDAEAALRALNVLSGAACVAVKHNNPCGVAEGKTLNEALKKALAADPVSVFGGIVALNQKITRAEAELLTGLFLEVVIAPSFEPEALEVFRKKKNLRLVEFGGQTSSWTGPDIRFVRGGALVQDSMVFQEDPSGWNVIGEPLSPREEKDILLSLKVVSELKSNAIAIVRDGQTIGLGMGQVNRVDAVEQALQRAMKFHPDTSEWTLASDAFFPFPDSIELMAQYPIKNVVQPGGSIKDDLVIEAAKNRGIRMVLTGRRYFRH